MPLHGKIVVIKRDGGDGTEFPLTASCLFGRKPDCDIRIQLPHVSKEHCKIELNENKEVILTNLSSVNPTRVNGEELQQSERLKHGDVITIIDRCFRFEYPPAPTPKKRRSSTTGKTEKVKVLQDQQLRDSTIELGGKRKISELSTDPHLKDGANNDNIQRLVEKTAEMETKENESLQQCETTSPFSDLYQMVKQTLSASQPQTPVSKFCKPNPGSFRKTIGIPTSLPNVKGTPKKSEVAQDENKIERISKMSNKQQQSLDILVSDMTEHVAGEMGSPERPAKPATPIQETPKSKRPSLLSKAPSTAETNTTPQRRSQKSPQKFIASEGVEMVFDKKPKTPTGRRSTGATAVSPAVAGEKAKHDQVTEAQPCNTKPELSPRKSPRASPRSAEKKLVLQDLDTTSSANGKRASTKRRSCEVRDPMEMTVSKKKRVSFGGHLSPELFDKRLPPDSPLRRGATPRYSLCVSKSKQSLLRRASVIGLIEEQGYPSPTNPRLASPAKARTPSPGKQSPKARRASTKTLSPGKQSPKARTPSAKTPSPVKQSPKARTPAKTPSPGKQSPKARTPSAKTPSPGKQSPKARTPSAKTPSPGKQSPKARTPSAKTPSPSKQSPKARTPSAKAPRPGKQSPKARTPSLGKAGVKTSPGRKSLPAAVVIPSPAGGRSPFERKAQNPATSMLPAEPQSADKKRSSAVVGSTPATQENTPAVFPVTPTKTPKQSGNQTPTVHGRFSVSHISTPSPITKQFTATPSEPSVQVTPKLPLKRKSMKITPRKTPKSAARLSGRIMLRRSGVSRVSMKVLNSWADIVRFGKRKPQVRAAGKKTSTRTKKTKASMPKPKTPVKRLKDNVSTGHADSPATIVVGKAHRQKVVQPKAPAPRVIHNIGLLKKNMKMDEDLTGIAELFKTPCTSRKNKSVSNVQSPTETPSKASTSVMEGTVMNTPEETGEMVVSPLSVASSVKCKTTYNSEAVHRLLHSSDDSSFVSEIAVLDVASEGSSEQPCSDVNTEMLTPKKRRTKSDCYTGVKTLLKTPRQKMEPVEDLRGRLLKTPRQKLEQPQCLSAVKRIMKTPKQKTEPVEDLRGKLLKTPKAPRCSGEADLDGVKELLETPRHRDEPTENLTGVVVEPVEDMEGIKGLLKTPKEMSELTETPVKQLKDHVSTGHADSPAAIVVGKAHTQMVVQPDGAAPQVVQNVALVEKNMKMDEDSTGIAELFRTRRTSRKNKSVSNVQSSTETPSKVSPSVMEGTVMSTPEETGEMVVSPLSVASSVKCKTTYNSEAVHRLLHSSDDSSFVSEIAVLDVASEGSSEQPCSDVNTEMLTPKKRGAKSDCYTGVKTLLKTPRQKMEPVEDLRGRLLKTPRQKPEQPQCLSAVKRIMKTPKQKTEPVEDLRGKLLKTPKAPRCSGEADLEGVKELLETPRHRDEPTGNLTEVTAANTPQVKSSPMVCAADSKRMMTTPKEKAAPVLDVVGIESLKKTPRQKVEPLEDTVSIKRLTKTPKEMSEPVEENFGLRWSPRLREASPVEDFAGLQELIEEPALETREGQDEINQEYESVVTKVEPEVASEEHQEAEICAQGEDMETVLEADMEKETEDVSSDQLEERLHSHVIVPSANTETAPSAAVDQPEEMAQAEMAAGQDGEEKTASVATEPQKRSACGKSVRTAEPEEGEEEKQETTECPGETGGPASVRGRRGRKTEEAPPPVRRTTRDRGTKSNEDNEVKGSDPEPSQDTDSLKPKSGGAAKQASVEKADALQATAVEVPSDHSPPGDTLDTEISVTSASLVEVPPSEEAQIVTENTEAVNDQLLLTDAHPIHPLPCVTEEVPISESESTQPSESKSTEDTVEALEAEKDPQNSLRTKRGRKTKQTEEKIEDDGEMQPAEKSRRTRKTKQDLEVNQTVENPPAEKAEASVVEDKKQETTECPGEIAVPVSVRGRRGKKTEEAPPPPVRKTTRGRGMKSNEDNEVTVKGKASDSVPSQDTDSVKPKRGRAAKQASVEKADALQATAVEVSSDHSPPVDTLNSESAVSSALLVDVSPSEEAQIVTENTEAVNDQPLLTDAHPIHPLPCVTEVIPISETESTQPSESKSAEDTVEALEAEKDPQNSLRTKRGRKTKQTEEKIEDDGEMQHAEKSRRTRKTKQDPEVNQTVENPVAEKTEASVVEDKVQETMECPGETAGPAPVRGRRGKKTEAPPPPVRKTTRGRGTKSNDDNEVTVKGKGSNSVPSQDTDSVKPKRGRAAKQAVNTESAVTSALEENTEAVTNQPLLMNAHPNHPLPSITEEIHISETGSTQPPEIKATEDTVEAIEAEQDPQNPVRTKRGRKTKQTEEKVEDDGEMPPAVAAEVKQPAEKSRRTRKTLQDPEVDQMVENPPAEKADASLARRGRRARQVKEPCVEPVSTITLTEAVDLCEQTVTCLTEKPRRGRKEAKQEAQTLIQPATADVQDKPMEKPKRGKRARQTAVDAEVVHDLPEEKVEPQQQFGVQGEKEETTQSTSSCNAEEPDVPAVKSTRGRKASSAVKEEVSQATPVRRARRQTATTTAAVDVPILVSAAFPQGKVGRQNKVKQADSPADILKAPMKRGRKAATPESTEEEVGNVEAYPVKDNKRGACRRANVIPTTANDEVPAAENIASPAVEATKPCKKAVIWKEDLTVTYEISDKSQAERVTQTRRSKRGDVDNASQEIPSKRGRRNVEPAEPTTSEPAAPKTGSKRKASGKSEEKDSSGEAVASQPSKKPRRGAKNTDMAPTGDVAPFTEELASTPRRRGRAVKKVSEPEAVQTVEAEMQPRTRGRRTAKK